MFFFGNGYATDKTYPHARQLRGISGHTSISAYEARLCVMTVKLNNNPVTYLLPL